ncbi:sensory box histidine kinase/response regulator [Dissulfuribacter thermophilus]|uniref:histidine kinase n=2 Tax=Dissulfuribacter thermophilus TaxID=1156395 RepID=A0A1B9F4S1_9BACT|nr:sensory box histidine kinase/response regulator [Dissulfuribacter thermophilus]
MKRLFASCDALIRDYFYRDHRLLSFIASQAPLGPDEAVKRYFKEAMSSLYGDIDYVVLDKSGRILMVGKPELKQYVGLDMSGIDYVKNNLSISKVHQSFFSSRPVITFSYPVRGGKRLLVERDLEGLSTVIGKIAVPLIKGSVIFVLTSYGTVVYHPDRDLMKRRENLKYDFEQLSGPDKYGLYRLIFNGKEYWCYKEALSMPKGWHFYAIIPMRNIMLYIWHNIWPILFAIFLIFFIALVGVDKIIYKCLTKSIKELSDWLIKIDPSNSEDFFSSKQMSHNSSCIEIESIIESINNLLETIYENNQELLKRDQQLRTIIESAADWAYWIDENGHFKYNSRRCEAITGYSQEEFQKNPGLIFEIVHPEDRKRFEDHFQRIQSDLPHEPLEFRIIRKDGEIRWISHNCTRIFDSKGAFLGIRASNLDITDQKHASIELAKIDKLESLGVVAGGIAHDFNNLLTAILGNVSLAKMQPNLDTKVYERLEAAEKASLRAKSLTQQLLTFARGGSPIKRLSSLKKIILETTDFVLKGSNVACRFEFAEDLWAVEVDPGQFSQVIQNLVMNADQAMPNGGTITIKAQNIEIENKHHKFLSIGKYVLISIEDQGVGIPKEHLPKIFDPYFSTKEQGSGLGLAVCFSIIRKHGGYIRVDSELGKGTRFDIYLPAAQTKLENGEHNERLPSTHIERKRILVMDDENNILELLKESLNYLGYEVELTRTGEEAIKCYENAMREGRPFDAVIMDVTIPGGMGGKEAVKILLEKDPSARVIVSSGYAKDDIITNFKKYGFCEALVKPYKLEELSNTLLKVLSE